MYARSDISPERGARLDLAAPKNESRGDSTEDSKFCRRRSNSPVLRGSRIDLIRQPHWPQRHARIGVRAVLLDEPGACGGCAVSYTHLTLPTILLV